MSRAAIDRAGQGRGRPPIDLLVPIAVSREWPPARQAAVQALTELLAEWRIAESHLDSLLVGIAAMHPPPWGPEEDRFGGLARVIGVGRLAERLRGPEQSRVGAAALLLAEGGSFAVHLVATLDADPAPAVRRLARLAVRSMRREGSDERRRDVDRSESGSTDGHAGATAHEMIKSADPAVPEMLERADAAAPSRPAPGGAAPGNAARRPEPAGLESVFARPVPTDPQMLLEAASFAEGPEREASERALASLGLDGDRLVRLAAAVDPVHRADAVRVIRRIGGRSILPFLPELASDSAGAVRTAVVEAMAESAGPGGVELARRLLRDDSSASVRAASVWALARAGGAVAVDASRRGLSDPDPDVRAVAVEALAPGNPEAVDLLGRALGDEDAGVWKAALQRMAVLEDRGLPLLWSAIMATPAERRDELLRAIERRDPADLAALALAHAGVGGPAERALAVEMAARAATPECTDVVIGALQDPDPVVRETAIGGLSEMRTPRAVPALTARLADPQVGVRIEALRALAVIDDEGVPPALVSALKDPEVLVRDIAADAIMAWRSAPMAGRLVEALGTPNLRRQAAELLERMGPSVMEPLVAVVTGGDVEAAGAAARVLERTVGSGRFVADLSSPNVADRLRAVTVIGALGDEAALEALPAALADPDVTIRARAASLLGAIGDHRSLPHLERTARSDPASEVASAARAAIERIAGPAVPAVHRNAEENEEAGDGPRLRRV
ncbi:MAG: HEAT repeat domain-containing protein [Actinomycetota bacterium]